jgi:hypothetical protein
MKDDPFFQKFVKSRSKMKILIKTSQAQQQSKASPLLLILNISLFHQTLLNKSYFYPHPPTHLSLFPTAGRFQKVISITLSMS